MIRFLIAILFLFPISVNAGIKYMSPTGNNANTGAIGSPWLTIEYATSQLTSGDTLYLRGGTYRSTKSSATVNRFLIQSLSGSSGSWFYILNYPGENPIFNLDDVFVPGTAGDGPVGLKLIDCNYVKIKGIRITGLAQNPANINTPAGVILYNVDNSVIELLEIDNIQGYGMYLQGGSDNNLVKNCDVHDIGDVYSGWGGANGFNCTGGDASTNNTFEGNRAYRCSDDGFDLYGVDGTFTFINNWSFWNGYQPNVWPLTSAGDGNGFKLGPTATNQTTTVRRYLYGNMSFKNKTFGYSQNSPYLENKTCLYVMYNNTAYSNNGYDGYFWGAEPSLSQTFKNNLNYVGNIGGSEISSGVNIVNNSWNGYTVTDADFQSVDTTGVTGPRGLDGSLPVLNFLRITTTSDMYNVCTDYGYGTSIGAMQYVAPPPANQGIKIRGKRIIFRNQ